MYHQELEIPFQQNISDRFLIVVNQLRKTQEPGRIFDLTREPTKDEMKFLTNNYGNEIGLSRLNKDKTWKIIEGQDEREVKILPEIERISDIIAYYHPARKNLSAILPSLEDVYCVSSKVKNFIISNEGMIYYSEIIKHPKTELPWKPSIYTGLLQLKELFRSLAYQEKDKSEFDMNKFAETFLGKMGVKIIRKRWKELPNNPFSGFKI